MLWGGIQVCVVVLSWTVWGGSVVLCRGAVCGVVLRCVVWCCVV